MSKILYRFGDLVVFDEMRPKFYIPEYLKIDIRANWLETSENPPDSFKIQVYEFIRKYPDEDAYEYRFVGYK